MRKQNLLDLRSGDVVTRGDDHVVRARLVPEVAVGVADVGVASEIPAPADVAALAIIGQVAAASRTLDGEPAWLTIGHGLAVGIQDLGAVPRNRQSGRSRLDLVVGGRDKDV